MDKSLCNDCRLAKLKTTNNCLPYDYDEKGNVIRCQAYEPEGRHIINCIINFVRRKNV
jgi:hypothetical protein